MSRVMRSAVVLIASGDATRRTALRRSLAAAGYAVHAASTSAGASRLIARERPELIVVDADLRDVSGAELRRLLHTEGAAPPVPIIGLVETPGEEEAATPGEEADLLLPYRVSPSLLRQAVGALLSARAARAMPREPRQERQGAQLEGARLLDAILADSPNSIAYIGPGLRLLLANPAFMSRAGHRGARAGGQPLADILPDREHLEMITQVMRTGERLSLRELPCPSTDHEPTYWHWDLTPVPDPSEAGMGVLLTSVDVSELVRARHRAEQARCARSREARLLATILANTANGVAYLDPGLRYVRANARYAELAGLSPEQIVGRAFLEVFPQSADVHATMQQVLKTREPAGFDEFPRLLYRRPELGLRYLDFVITPVLGEEGEVEGLVSSVLDVTDRVSQREQLLAAERARTALAESLRDEIAHRVGNNLAMVSGLLQMQALSAGDEQLSAALRDAVSRIRLFAQIHECMYAPVEERVELLSILRLIARNAQEAYSSRAPVEVVVTGSRVTCAPPHATNLSAIAHELIVNALKHGAPNPERGSRVEVKMGRRGNLVHLSVWSPGHPVTKGFDLHAQKGVGLRMISDLVGQYAGSFAMRARGGGTLAVVRLEAGSLR